MPVRKWEKVAELQQVKAVDKDRLKNPVVSFLLFSLFCFVFLLFDILQKCFLLAVQMIHTFSVKNAGSRQKEPSI
jgi:hypothetical protein